MHTPKRTSIFRTTYLGQIAKILPLLIVVPLSMILFGDFNGDTVTKAFATSRNMITSPKAGTSIWSIVIGSAFLIIWYLKPVLMFNRRCRRDGTPSRHEAMQVINRFNKLSFMTTVISVAGFTFVELLSQMTAEGNLIVGIARNFLLLNAFSKGFLIGVIIAFNLENILFESKKMAIALYPDIKLKKTSLYKKVFTIMGAIVFFFIFQLFGSTAHFFSMGSRILQSAQPEMDFNFFIVETLQKKDLHGALGIYLIKISLYLFYVIELMMQIKGLIQHPVQTIRDRLGSLISSDPKNSRIIDIVANDEYAEVYSRINTLIQRQQHDLECSSVRLEMIVDQAADPILSFDDEGTLLVFNPAAELFFGFTASEMLGKPLLELIEFPVDGESLCDDYSQEKALIDHLYGHQNEIKRFTGNSQKRPKKSV